jgi:hypothetical protein
LTFPAAAEPKEVHVSGALVISLDFELAWGMLGMQSPHGRYRPHLEGVWDVVPGTLELFERHGVHATWATVGMLAMDGREAWRAAWPAVRPDGLAAAADPYRVEPDEASRAGSVWFAAELIDAIVSTPHQELASHGFAHLACMEGVDRRAFQADLEAATAAFKRWQVTPRSFVWPKHQVRRDWLDDLTAAGFDVHRGPARHVLYTPRAGRAGGLHIRAGRLADAVVPLSGSGSHAWPPTLLENGPIDVPESHFVRPLPRPLAWTAERFQVGRLQQAMTHAARQGRLLHLWWHPHNFGADPKSHLRDLRRLLQHAQALNQDWSFPSLTMLEAASEVPGPATGALARLSAASYTASYAARTAARP